MRTNAYYRTIQTVTWSAILVLIALVLSGCFWTPDDAREGGVNLRIHKGDLSAARTLDEVDGLYLGFIISDDLMRGDNAAAEQALDEVFEGFYNGLNDWYETSYTDPESFDPSDFSVSLSFPSIQVQAEFFTGTSGTSDFRGLRAEEDYLVVVIANTFEPEIEGVGYDVVEIKAGESRTVDLDISDANWTGLERFLVDRYDLDYTPDEYVPPEAPVDVPATIVITGDGLPGGQGGPEIYLYYDLIDGDAGLPSEGTWNTNFENWYIDNVVNSDGDRIDASGPRDPVSIPLDSQTIAVAPGKSWRVMIATWEERSETDHSSLSLQGSAYFYVSREITPAAGDISILEFTTYVESAFQLGSGFYGFFLNSTYLSATSYPPGIF